MGGFTPPPPSIILTSPHYTSKGFSGPAKGRRGLGKFAQERPQVIADQKVVKMSGGRFLGEWFLGAAAARFWWRGGGGYAQV